LTVAVLELPSNTSAWAGVQVPVGHVGDTLSQGVAHVPATHKPD
jgi:hypothetical protein